MGSHFIKYISLNGYDKIMAGLGTNLHDFLVNIDFLHLHLSNTFDGIKSPSFRVSHNHQGTMKLLYSSPRKGIQMKTSF